MKKPVFQIFWIFLISTAAALGAMPAVSRSDSGDLYRVPGREAMKLEGVVVERSDRQVLIRRQDGSQVLVSWSDDTRIRERKSNFFRGARKYSEQDLLLGLSVMVKGRGDGSGRLAAQEIKFTQDDLETARAITSSLEPVERQLDDANREISRVEKRLAASEARNEMVTDQLSGEIEDMGEGLRKARSDLSRTQQGVDQALAGVEETNHRITALDDFEVARSLTVLFRASSSRLTEEAAADLKAFAESVKEEAGYLIEVTGHASSDGNAEYNRRLSERRAKSVRDFLAEAGEISLRRFISPYGFGESRPVDDDSTREGRRQNRRVEIRLLINRGFVKGSEWTATNGSNYPG